MVRVALTRRGVRGSALITAMLIAAIAAAVVATIAASQMQWLRTVELRRDQVQAQALVLAGLQWARTAIEQDARAGPIDHLGEPWALPLPPTPLENGSIEGAIVDAQALLNLNNLAGNDPVGRAERKRFARLFAREGMAGQALESLIDWIDSDETTADGGDEAQLYAQAGTARVPPNGPLLRSAEVVQVRGLGEAQFTRIARHVVALPRSTALNVNTALPEVLALAVDGLDGDAMARFIDQRATRPFITIAEFRARLPDGASVPDEQALGVRSDFFVVTVRARQGETVAMGRALVQRGAQGSSQIVWQTIE
jgi:general secretion pathway protein K